MGVEEIAAWHWSCDWCGQQKLIPGDDVEPPLSWITQGLFSFCCNSHYWDWLKKHGEIFEF